MGSHNQKSRDRELDVVAYPVSLVPKDLLCLCFLSVSLVDAGWVAGAPGGASFKVGFCGKDPCSREFSILGMVPAWVTGSPLNHSVESGGQS